MTYNERNDFEKIFSQWLNTRAGSGVVKFIAAARDFNADFNADFENALYKTLESYQDRDDRFKEAAAFDARYALRPVLKAFRFTDDQADRVFSAMQNAATEYAR